MSSGLVGTKIALYLTISEGLSTLQLIYLLGTADSPHPVFHILHLFFLEKLVEFFFAEIRREEIYGQVKPSGPDLPFYWGAISLPSEA